MANHTMTNKLDNVCFTDTANGLKKFINHYLLPSLKRKIHSNSFYEK